MPHVRPVGAQVHDRIAEEILAKHAAPQMLHHQREVGLNVPHAGARAVTRHADQV